MSLEQTGHNYRNGRTARALVEQTRQQVAMLANLQPEHRAVIADLMRRTSNQLWADAKGRALHDLEETWTYEQLGELLGHRRNVVQRSLAAWRRRTSTPPHSGGKKGRPLVDEPVDKQPTW